MKNNIAPIIIATAIILLGLIIGNIKKVTINIFQITDKKIIKNMYLLVRFILLQNKKQLPLP
jgi:hypothetical protein